VQLGFQEEPLRRFGVRDDEADDACVLVPTDNIGIVPDRRERLDDRRPDDGVAPFMLAIGPDEHHEQGFMRPVRASPFPDEYAGKDFLADDPGVAGDHTGD
jgi:hypothetical protein